VSTDNLHELDFSVTSDAICRDLLLELPDVQILHLLLQRLVYGVGEWTTALVMIVSEDSDIDIRNVLQVRQGGQR
jgi:hypothetical protein